MTYPLTIVAEIGSTSLALRELAEAGAHEQALLARQQTAGRGRLGRPWSSVAGNLYCSVLVRPIGLFHAGHWSLLTAVALATALERILPATCRPRLKWPNDVMIRDGKVAGILIEAGDGWLVIGFGVNLAGRPEGLGRPVACIADIIGAPEPETFASVLLSQLGAWRARYVTEGFAPVRAAWSARGPADGVPVGVMQGPERIDGRFIGIGEGGSMLLHTPAGQRVVTVGEVV